MSSELAVRHDSPILLAIGKDLDDPILAAKLSRLSLTPLDVIEGASIQIAANTTLQRCSIASIVDAVRSATLVGARLHPVFKEGYLIPYNNVCTFMPSYILFKRLAERSPTIRAVSARLVRQGERFHCSYNPQLDFFHEVLIKCANNPIVAAYSHISFANGETSIEMMSIEEIRGIRDRSDSYIRYQKRKKSGEWTAEPPWIVYEGEMAKKTALKRQLKSADIAPELAHAIALDDRDYIDRPRSVSSVGLSPMQPIVELPPAEKNTRFRKIMSRLLDRADKQYRAEFGESYAFGDQAFEDLTRGSLYELDCIQTLDADLDEILNDAKSELESHIRAVFNAKRASLPTAPATHEREPGEDG